MEPNYSVRVRKDLVIEVSAELAATPHGQVLIDQLREQKRRVTVTD